MYKYTMGILFFLVSCIERNDKRESSMSTAAPVTAHSKQDSTESDKLIAVQQQIWKATHGNETGFQYKGFKTYAQLRRNMFSEGCTKREVENIQGSPELKEKLAEGREDWYYGKCAVHFKHSLVRSVSSPNPAIRYASYLKLLGSDVPHEKQMGQLMIDRLAEQDSP